MKTDLDAKSLRDRIQYRADEGRSQLEMHRAEMITISLFVKRGKGCFKRLTLAGLIAFSLLTEPALQKASKMSPSMVFTPGLLFEKEKKEMERNQFRRWNKGKNEKPEYRKEKGRERLPDEKLTFEDLSNRYHSNQNRRQLYVSIQHAEE